MEQQSNLGANTSVLGLTGISYPCMTCGRVFYIQQALASHCRLHSLRRRWRVEESIENSARAHLKTPSMVPSLPYSLECNVEPRTFYGPKLSLRRGIASGHLARGRRPRYCLLPGARIVVKHEVSRSNKKGEEQGSLTEEVAAWLDGLIPMKTDLGPPHNLNPLPSDLVPPPNPSPRRITLGPLSDPKVQGRDLDSYPIRDPASTEKTMKASQNRESNGGSESTGQLVAFGGSSKFDGGVGLQNHELLDLNRSLW